MRPERWQEIEGVFHAALERPESQRAAFLDQACAGDGALREEVKSLLAHKDKGSFIESPAMDVAAKVLAQNDSELRRGQEDERQRIGSMVAHYRILEKLGSGGMGVVYKAENTHLNCTVAIKFLPQEVAHDREALRRFSREAHAASALNHPNICTVHDLGEHEGQPFIVMECLEGQTLKKLIEVGEGTTLPFGIRRVAIQPEKLVDLGIQVANALDAAHSRGIVHRDIKPANIFITEHGEAKLLDFGLAKLVRDRGAKRGATDDSTTSDGTLTSSGDVVGTAEYMSPEQVRAEEIDTRTDLFSLGLVLYEMAAGQRAFSGDSVAAVVNAIQHRVPPSPRLFNPDVPPRLDEIISKAIEKDRALRYQTASDLRADLQRLKRDTESEQTNIQPVVAVHRSARKGRWWGAAGIASLALVAIAMLLVGLNVNNWRDRLLGHPTALPIRSLAVLPLENLMGDPQQEYFVDGMTEELTAALSQISALRVISRTSVMQYKDTKKSMREIGRELNVDGVIEGSVLRAGNRVRITAQLIEARTDRHIWASNYDRDLRDILALQGEVAGLVAHEVQVNLTPQEQARLARAQPVIPEAHLAYLRGRHALEKYTQENLSKALEYFQKAIEIDPTYAPAYAGMADVHYGFSNIYISPREAMPRVKMAALKALALDETLAEAHVSLAMAKLKYDYDYPGAEIELRRAIELNPNYAPAHLEYGFFLAVLGRFEEAKAEVARARELDPLSLFIRTYGFLPVYFARRYEEAAKQLQDIALTDPNYYFVHAYLGLVYEQQGKLSEAVAEFERATALDDSPEPRAQLAHAYALAGRKAEARKLLAELLERIKHQYLSPYNIATIYVALGDYPRALQSLEDALEDRSEWCPYLKVDPRLDPLRADPHFQNLLRRMNYPPEGKQKTQNAPWITTTRHLTLAGLGT
jgi:serine/threonine protein kinase/TolB-like protein/Tfp pilus assembly protein PilF